MTTSPDLNAHFDLVWLQTGFIGDIVLTTAAMALAKICWPHKDQHLITTKVGAQILADAPELKSCLVFDKAGTSMMRATNQVRRDLKKVIPAGRKAILLQAHRSPRSTILARSLGLPVVSYEESSGAWMSWQRVPRVAVLHEAHRIALLLEPLGISREKIVKALPALVPLPLTPEIPWHRNIMGHGGRIVAVAPGSVWGTKRWLPEYFAELTRVLLAADGTMVVFVGSPAESEIASQIVAMLGDSQSSLKLLNLVGKTSLEDLRRVLPRCSLLVANDSSPIHYASALGVPTVAIFGATVPGMGFAPLAPKSSVVGVELDCRPCSDHGPQRCPLEHFRCMRTLSVEQVAAACRRVMHS